MQSTKLRWDRERAAAWLRRHGWGDTGEEPAPPLAQPAAATAEPAAAGAAGSIIDEGIDVAGWPALVAPFYD
jgi:hypothetical protein